MQHANSVTHIGVSETFTILLEYLLKIRSLYWAGGFCVSIGDHCPKEVVCYGPHRWAMALREGDERWLGVVCDTWTYLIIPYRWQHVFVGKEKFARSIPASYDSIPPCFQPRARIAGAKATCEAKKATHIRPCTLHSQKISTYIHGFLVKK